MYKPCWFFCDLELIPRQYFGSHYSSIGIVIKLRPGQSFIRFSEGVWGFSLLQNVHSWYRAYPVIYLFTVGVSYPRIKRQVVKLITFPSYAEVKNLWKYTSASPLCIHELFRDKSILWMWLSVKFEYTKLVSVTHKIPKYISYNISTSNFVCSRHCKTVNYFVIPSVTIEVRTVVP